MASAWTQAISHFGRTSALKTLAPVNRVGRHMTRDGSTLDKKPLRSFTGTHVVRTNRGELEVPLFKDGRYSLVPVTPETLPNLSALLKVSYELMSDSKATEGVHPMGYIPSQIMPKLLAKSDVGHLGERMRDVNYYFLLHDEAVIGSCGVNIYPGTAPATYPFSPMLSSLNAHRIEQLTLTPDARGKGHGTALLDGAQTQANLMGCEGRHYLIAPPLKALYLRPPRVLAFPALDYFIYGAPVPKGFSSFADWNKTMRVRSLEVDGLKRVPGLILEAHDAKQFAEAKMDRAFLGSPDLMTAIVDYLNKYPFPGGNQKIPHLYKALGAFACTTEAQLEKKLSDQKRVYSESIRGMQENPNFEAREVIPPNELFNPAGHSVCVLSGTFNPVHRGHIEALVQAVGDTHARYGVLVVPITHPTKNGKELMSIEDRLVLLQLIQKKYPWISVVVVNQAEWKTLYPRFSDLVKHGHSTDRLYNVIGSDKVGSCFKSRDKYQSDRVVSHYVVVRGDDNDSIYSVVSEIGARGTKLYPTDIVKEHVEKGLVDVSSTKVRSGNRATIKVLDATRQFMVNLNYDSGSSRA